MKEILLTKGKFAIVDDEDFEFLSRLTLRISTQGDVIARFENHKKSFTISVTFLLLKPPGRMYPIHINKNKLDLQKENLRLADESQLNHGIRINYKNAPKTSQYRGVVKKASGKYLGQIMHKGQRFTSGNTTEIEAVIWYNKKAKELFGEFAYQNKI